MKRQFLSSLLEFQKAILSDTKATDEFITKSSSLEWIRQISEVESGFEKFRDQLPDKTLERKNLDKILRKAQEK